MIRGYVSRDYRTFSRSGSKVACCPDSQARRFTSKPRSHEGDERYSIAGGTALSPLLRTGSQQRRVVAKEQGRVDAHVGEYSRTSSRLYEIVFICRAARHALAPRLHLASTLSSVVCRRGRWLNYQHARLSSAMPDTGNSVSAKAWEIE